MFMTWQLRYGHIHGVRAYPAVYSNTCGLLDVRQTSIKLFTKMKNSVCPQEAYNPG